MSRTTYVYRDGKIVPKADAGPISTRSRPAGLISDTMDPTWHPADGKYYDSKSRFRAETRARGLTEVGNERQKDTRTPFAGDLRAEVAQAREKVNGGYRPSVQNERDF